MFGADMHVPLRINLIKIQFVSVCLWEVGNAFPTLKWPLAVTVQATYLQMFQWFDMETFSVDGILTDVKHILHCIFCSSPFLISE